MACPVFNDAAADVPPISNLWNYTQMGFDLVTFSGGKGIRGPQNAGLLWAARTSSRRRHGTTARMTTPSAAA